MIIRSGKVGKEYKEQFEKLWNKHWGDEGEGGKAKNPSEKGSPYKKGITNAK